jgi:tetratricopeptide (TPR) repeat protein
MSDAGEERVSQADRPGDQPITLHEIGEAPPSELFDKGKNSLLKWLEEHPLIRWIAILSVIVGAVFSIFTFFTGANRCAVQPAAGDELLAIVADFNQGGVVTGARIYNSLADQLAEDGSTNVRLAWVAGVAPRTREQAQRIGETCRATMVIWGVADGAGVPVQYEVGSPRTVGQGLKSSELYVREDAPLEYTYLVSFTLGRIEYLAQDFDASLVWFDQSVGVVEGMSEAQQRALAASLLYNYRGLLYYKQGGYEQSIADYNRAIELDLESVAAYVNRGNSYDDMGEYELAVADYNRAIELDPDEAGAYVNRGLAYSYQGSLGPAIADYDRAIELDPTFAGAYFCSLTN